MYVEFSHFDYKHFLLVILHKRTYMYGVHVIQLEIGKKNLHFLGLFQEAFALADNVTKPLLSKKLFMVLAILF